MRLIILLFFIIPICGFSQHKLKGTYQQTPIIFTTSKSVDEVWISVIDYFSSNGIGVKTIDKASGLIVGYSKSLLSKFTYEDDSTSPEDKKAWIVVKKIHHLRPAEISTDFNIRVRKEEDKTLVSINLFNITAESNKSESPKWRYIDCASTGVFEKNLLDIIK